MYKLKIRREAAGLTQAQLSEMTGVPIRMIQAYEAEAASSHRDINKAEAARVAKLAAVIGCRVIDILEPEAGGQDE